MRTWEILRVNFFSPSYVGRSFLLNKSNLSQGYAHTHLTVLIIFNIRSANVAKENYPRTSHTSFATQRSR